MLLPSASEIIELVKKGATLPAQEKIMELRQAALDIQEDNLTLRTRVKELEDQLTIREQLHWDRPYYWVGSGESKDGPYCQTCYDSAKKLIRLQGGTNGQWSCRTCKTVFYDSSYKSPIPRRVSGSWF